VNRDPPPPAPGGPARCSQRNIPRLPPLVIGRAVHPLPPPACDMRVPRPCLPPSADGGRGPFPASDGQRAELP
jgi:hypothetical protein